MSSAINLTSLLKTANVQQTSSANSTSKAESSTKAFVEKSTEENGEITSTSDKAKLKEELETLEKLKKANVQKMEKIEKQVENLAKQAEQNILEAAKKQEKAVEQNEEQAKKALNENIEAYIKANKEGGKGMTKDELQANIRKSMPDAPGLGNALAKLTAARAEIAQIDSLLGSLNGLILEVEGLNLDISSKQADYDKACEAEEPPAQKCCDPIGFTVGEGENQVRYDFIVDDGSFDTTSDFLGADNQWAEMEALDLDQNGTVTAQELSKGKIKAVKTTPDGKQEVVDIAKEFGDDFTIDLSSYQQGGSHSSIDTEADFDNDGVIDQKLLGTFDVNVGGQSIKGYNTLDDVDYLNKQYGVEIDTTQQEVSSDDELALHTNFFNEYTQKSQELSNSLEEGFTSLGVSRENIKEIKKEALNEGNEQANIFMQKLEEEQKTQEDKETQEQEELEQEELEKEEAKTLEEKQSEEEAQTKE